MLVESPLVALYKPYQNNLQVFVGFPNPILAHLDIVFVFLQPQQAKKENRKHPNLICLGKTNILGLRDEVLNLEGYRSLLLFLSGSNSHNYWKSLFCLDYIFVCFFICLFFILLSLYAL